jgi:3-oxoacyl-[acyl-carrier-protein] synthase II
MADRRVVITGIGAVTPAGVGIEALWQGLVEGRPCVDAISAFDASGFPCPFGGQVEGFSARKFVPKSYRKSVKVMARDIELAVAAADLAVRDAGIVTVGTDDLGEPNVDPKRLGCNIGAGLICADLEELGLAVNTAVEDGAFSMKAWGERGIENLTPLWLLKYLPNMLSCHVTIIHDAEGPSNCITCGDASGQLAIGESARWIRRGTCDVAFAGGAESKINPMGMARQQLLNRLCTSRADQPAQAVRPFDTSAAGTAIGEGGALLMLEELDRAKARGARIYAEVVGQGAACDPAGIDVTQPTSGSLHLAAKAALGNAGLTGEDVDLVVALGTGVPGEDRLESGAWAEALGRSVPAVSTTGAMGQLFAGSGAVQAAVACLAIQHQVVPGTVNFHEGFGEDLDLSAQPREGRIDCVLAGATSVGGQSAVVALKRYEP